MLCYKETVTDDETGGNTLSVKYISGAGDIVRDEAGLTILIIDEDTTTGAKIERKYDYTANGNLAKET